MAVIRRTRGDRERKEIVPFARDAHGELSGSRTLHQSVWLSEVAGLGVAACGAGYEVGRGISGLPTHKGQLMFVLQPAGRRMEEDTDSSDLVRSDIESRSKELLGSWRRRRSSSWCSGEGASGEDERETGGGQHRWRWAVQMSGFAKAARERRDDDDNNNNSTRSRVKLL